MSLRKPFINHIMLLVIKQEKMKPSFFKEQTRKKVKFSNNCALGCAKDVFQVELGQCT